MNARPFFALALAACLLLPACSGRKAPRAAAKVSGTLAVAAFTQPRYDWELLAGYIPDNAQLVEPQVLRDLDARLDAFLDANKQLSAIPARLTRQCQEIAVYEQKGSRSSALKYWLEVGRCMGADSLLVPQLVYWAERDGSEMSVRSAAAVILDLYLVDVKGQALAGRFHFDETQLSLTENLLDAGKFMKRGGKWITAGQLAGEGIEKGLTEIGLK
ncbi:MAG: hypothetical protein AB1916_12670 [Thermodesulfobacteriota bacterium]